MPRFSFFRFRQRDKGKGQGLVEYALILVLVSIVVIAILTIFGKTLANTYCTITYNLKQQGSGTSSACKNPIPLCEIRTTGANNFSMEIVVIDPDKPSSRTLTQDIDVQFYINGTLDSHVEFNEKFCYPSGGDGTDPCDKGNSASGTVIRAVATDTDGNTGECTARVP
jgi:pilus assembly protein Flp/PilA